MPLYVAKHGSQDLAVLDLDLTGNIYSVFTVLSDVLMPLVEDNFKGKVQLTFTERGDEVDSADKRMQILRSLLKQDGFSKTVNIDKYRSYLSDRWDERARCKQGANMCIVQLSVKNRH
jgi:hypothetical protein